MRGFADPSSLLVPDRRGTAGLEYAVLGAVIASAVLAGAARMAPSIEGVLRDMAPDRSAGLTIVASDAPERF